MKTYHRIIFGNSANMPELADESIQLIVTSPPYFNAPFDYQDLFPSYEAYLDLIRSFAGEAMRVLEAGRVVAVNTDDMLVNGKRYPIVADTTKIFIDAGFNYRDRITWKKPEGYIRISRRSGVLLQHPWPLYYYPDNIQESVLIFQKGEFDSYSRRASRITSPSEQSGTRMTLLKRRSIWAASGISTSGK
jgi:site-specific DNA-methyltransferase (adenine-specific)